MPTTKGGSLKFDLDQCGHHRPRRFCEITAAEQMMRTLGLVTMVLLATASPALAESRWLESSRLDASEIGLLCQQVSGVRLLARMQMLSSGNDHWRRLARQELVVEAAIMGAPPLDPSRCYIVVRAGSTDEAERRAFEVRDFAVNPERTSVLIVGRAYDAPPDGNRLDY